MAYPRNIASAGRDDYCARGIVGDECESGIVLGKSGMTDHICGGLAVGGYGLFQLGAAVMGGATVAAAAPLLALPAAALVGGGLLVSAAKAIKG